MTRKKVQKNKNKKGDFRCGLWNQIGPQYGHLWARLESLFVRPLLLGRGADSGSVGWWCCGGVDVDEGGEAAGSAAVGAGGCHNRLVFLFGLLAGELCDAEDKLQAAQFEVAAVVEERRALPAGPAAPNQAGAACLAIAGKTSVSLGLAAHHSTCWHQTHRGTGPLLPLPLLTAACRMEKESIVTRLPLQTAVGKDGSSKTIPLRILG